MALRTANMSAQPLLVSLTRAPFRRRARRGQDATERRAFGFGGLLEGMTSGCRIWTGAGAEARGRQVRAELGNYEAVSVEGGFIQPENESFSRFCDRSCEGT
jgi:hypothetical protein